LLLLLSKRRRRIVAAPTRVSSFSLLPGYSTGIDAA
jgi:hypothetical protein